jgi:hypothetical protein
MHKRGIHFVENVESITGLGSNPKGTEMNLDEMDPQTDPNTEKEKRKCPKGILPSGRPLHAKVGDGGWMGKLAPGLGRVGG